MNATLSASGNTVRYGRAHGAAVSESRFAPRLAITEHTHRTGYLSVTLSGSVADTIVSREIVATPGYCCYVPPNTPHANTFGESGARCMLVEIDAPALGFLRDSECDITTPWSAFGAPSAWHGLAFYRLIRHEAATSLDCEEFLLRAFEGHPSKAAKHNRPPAWLSRTQERLEAELKRPPSLAALAS